MAQPVEYLKIDPKTQHMLDHTTTEFGDDKFWPLSGKPCFHVFLVKSQLKPLYHLVLPVKIQSMLPCSTVPVVLTYCGKKWEMIYYGEKSAKRFNWKEFAIDNGLKVGDACVFELMEISKTNLKFRVQILREDNKWVVIGSLEGQMGLLPATEEANGVTVDLPSKSVFDGFLHLQRHWECLKGLEAVDNGLGQKKLFSKEQSTYLKKSYK